MRPEPALRRLAWALTLVACALGAAEPERLPGSDQVIERAWREASLRDVGESTRFANRLALSDSAYLRQHADNPIDWFPWEDAVLAAADADGKLLFVSVGYASCHWCHVMERESFADVEVAEVLNGHFRSIKVDREQLPDIDARLSRVARHVQGEGGWPITLVLLPDATPVFAAHYLSREQLLTMARRLSSAWAEQPEALRAMAAQLAPPEPAAKAATEPPRPLADIAGDVTASLLAELDRDYGGFGRAEKFPAELRLQYLLDRYKHEPGAELRSALRGALDGFMAGGLADPVFGGVFRYTTDRPMTRPHYEKMLYNQALSARLFADAARWLDEPAYLDFARSIVTFAETTLCEPAGLCASAVDAEHQGVEGAYYLWRASQLPPLPDGVQPVDQGDGHLLLIGRPEVSGDGEWREELRALRPRPPRVTGNPVTAWNALYVLALLETGEVDRAVRRAEALWSSAMTASGLMRFGAQPAYLDDFAIFSQACWALYRHGFEPRWRDRARALDRQLLDRFVAAGELFYAATGGKAVPADWAGEDPELPSAAAALLASIGHHLVAPEFADAHDRLRPAALRAANGNREAAVQLLSTLEPPPASRRVIALGHGAAALRHDTGGRWVLDLDLEDDWHVNSDTVPSASLVPLQITAHGEGDSIITHIDYPPAMALETDFYDAPLSVYEGRVVVPLAAAGRALDVTIRLQACSRELCLLPENHRLVAFENPDP